MVEKGYDARVRRAHLQADRGLRRIRLPGEPRRQLCAAGLRERWIKRHHPDAFLAALLNSQPMGFYAPAQLVRDARAHGVRCCRSTCSSSGWDDACSKHEPDAAPMRLWPVRLGFDRLAGLSARGRRSACVRRARRRARSTASKTWRAAPARRARRCSCCRQADALQAAHRPPPPGRVGGRRHRHPRRPRCWRNTRTHEAPALLQAPSAGRRACWPTTAHSA